MGWCVGPSSPTPIESCVQTWVTGRSMRAARRTAPRMKSENTKKVPPYTRVRPSAAIPFIAQAIANSRIPKWRLRPYGSASKEREYVPSGRNEVNPLRKVLFDPPRSAEPPQSSGSTGAIAFSNFPEAERVAIALSAGNSGRAFSHPWGSPP